MKLHSNLKALSKIILILLLLVSFIVGALLSYMWVIAYYLEFKVAEDKTTLIITNATFNPQNAKHFNITVLNPSYSKNDANITQIGYIPEQNGTLISISNVTVDNEAHPFPTQPITLKRGEEKTISCKAYWGEFAGQNLSITVSAPSAVGPIVNVHTPFVKLEVTNATFDSSMSIKYFGITVRNHPNSTIPLDLIGITTPLAGNVSFNPSVLQRLNASESVTFNCTGNWESVENMTITVETLQGFEAQYSAINLPSLALLNMSNVDFDITDTKFFKATIQNEPKSPTRVNISKIEVTLENKTKPQITVAPLEMLTPPYNAIEPDSNKTFTCEWDWTNYRNKNLNITVYTSQGFERTFQIKTPLPINMTITNPSFNTANTAHFNITVKNSPYSLKPANITRITVTLENGTIIEINGTRMTPALPNMIDVNANQTFVCPWNWTSYQNKNITITVYTTEGYSTKISLKTPVQIIISIIGVEFNDVDTTHFKVTVKNSPYSIYPANVTRITVTLENGTNIEINGTQVVPALPQSIDVNAYVTFVCPWDWSLYHSKKITITVYTKEDSKAIGIFLLP